MISCVVRLALLRQYVLCACYSPDGRYIAASLNDGTVRIWDGNSLVSILIMDAVAYHIYFSPDSTHVVTASESGMVQVWDWKLAQAVLSVDIDDLYVIGADGIPYLDDSKYGFAKYIRSRQDVKTCSIFTVYTRDDYLIGSSSDGAYSATFYEEADGDRRENFMYVRSQKPGEPIKKVSISATEDKYDHSAVWCFCFSPDNKHIVIATSSGDISIWEITSGNMVGDLVEPDKYAPGVVTGSVNSVSYSPDGKRIISASIEGVIRIWDSEKLEMVHKIDSFKGQVYSAFYNHDGSRFVSASKDGVIKIWDGQSYDLVETIYPFSYMNVLKANLRGIQHDNLTGDDISALKQNGAIMDL